MMLRSSGRALALLTTLITGAAMACPTGADMQTGTLKITDQNGGTGYYTLKDGGLVLEEYDIEQEQGFWVESLYGIYVVRDGNLKNGEVDGDIRVLTFAQPLDQVPGPDQRGTYKVEAKMKANLTAAPEAENMIVTIGPIGRFGVAGCSYDSRLITLVTEFADGSNSLAQIAYLPELKIGFYHAYGTREDGLTDYYAARSISMVPKR